MNRIIPQSGVEYLIDTKVEVLNERIDERKLFGGRPASDEDVRAMRAQVAALNVLRNQLNWVPTVGAAA